MTLDRIEPTRRTGSEPLHANGARLGPTLLDCWQWAGSDLVSNAQRGVLAEFLVAAALGVGGGVRTEWDAFDLITSDGLKVEVKSAGYVQAWAQRALSRIHFDIAPKRAWDAATNESSPEPLRSADVYVFALHAHTDQATLDPLDVTQWDFRVLPTSTLDAAAPSQGRIGLTRLDSLGAERADFGALAAAIARACPR